MYISVFYQINGKIDINNDLQNEKEEVKNIDKGS